MARPINPRSGWAKRIQESLEPHYREAAGYLPEHLRPIIPSTPEAQASFMRLFLDNPETIGADAWRALKSNPAMGHIRQTQRNLGEEFDYVAAEMTAPKPVVAAAAKKAVPAAMKARKVSLEAAV